MFLHRYALAIGWPVPLLEKIMSSRDIAEAMAYDRIAPFGPERSDLRSGIIASVIANANRGKGGKPFTPQDFMPKFGKSKKKTLTDQICEVFKIGNPGNSSD